MVFECLDWNGEGCSSGTLYSTIARLLGVDNVTHLVENNINRPPSQRIIQPTNWTDTAPTCTHLAFITHADEAPLDTLPPPHVRYMMGAEWHDDRLAMIARKTYWQNWYLPGDSTAYLHVIGGSFTDKTSPGPDSTIYAVCFTENSVFDWLTPVNSEEGIIYANMCKGCYFESYWQRHPCASYLCYWEYVSPSAVGCPNTDLMMQCLACDMPEGSQVYPDAYSCHCDLVANTPTGFWLYHYPEPPPCTDSWTGAPRGGMYDPAIDCDLVEATYSDLHANSGDVVFATTNERRCLVHLVQGTDNLTNDAACTWETLARITPRNQPHARHVYYVPRLPTKAWYRIVSMEPGGGDQTSDVFRDGPRPQRWFEWIAEAKSLPLRRTASPRAETRSPAFWIDGALVPATAVLGERQSAGQSGRQEADSTYCADVLVYTSSAGYYMNFFTHFDSLMQRYPHLKTMYCTDTANLFDAVSFCQEIHDANLTYNAVSGTDRFPTALTVRRPLLVVLGDADPCIVGHLTVDDADSLCGCEEGVACCPSDRAVWDFYGYPFGMVHRVPASTEEEMSRACVAAAEWNEGLPENVDPDRRVIMTVGDYGQMRPEFTLRPAFEAAGRLPSRGYWPYPMLKERDFSPWCNDPAKKQAYRELLEAGVVVDWGIGARTSQVHWPGWFLSFPDSFPSAPRQRMIALEAGCHTVAVAGADTVEPFVEAWMFNDPEKTVLAGAVGHLAAGWLHQHGLAQRLYLDGWLSLCEGEGGG